MPTSSSRSPEPVSLKRPRISAAESSTGTNVEVSTTDDFTKQFDAIVYLADEETEEVRIAYPLGLFDRNVIDGRMMMVSFLTLTIGNNQVRAISRMPKCTTSTCSPSD